MTTELDIAGLRVAVMRKPIKNLHLGVYPPDGHVRVAAPLAMSEAAIRVAVTLRLRWIRRHQAAFAHQVRQSRRAMVSGESHYYQGRRYRLRVVAAAGAPRLELRDRQLVLHARPEASAAERERVMQRWYRDRLRELVPALLATWQARLGVEIRAWGIKRMKTRWGSCNPDTGRIWLNLELVKKPPGCLEYVVVHELAHLRFRRHDARFVALLDHHLPSWQRHRSELNAAPLADESWNRSGHKTAPMPMPQ